MLERVRVQRRESHRRGPLVVLLVDVLVDLGRTSELYFFTGAAGITSLYTVQLSLIIGLKLEGDCAFDQSP